MSKEGRFLLQKGLWRLSPLYVEVLQLLGTQELSAKTAAGPLEVPVGTIKARLHRARAKLTRHVRSITSQAAARQCQVAIEQCEGMGQYHRLMDSLSTFWLNRSCPQRLGKSR